jgi:hypothetical protein
MTLVDDDPFQLLVKHLRVHEIRERLRYGRFGDHEHDLCIVRRCSIVALNGTSDSVLTAPVGHVFSYNMIFGMTTIVTPS